MPIAEHRKNAILWRQIALATGALVLLYVCARMLAPFLAPLAWATALGMIGYPVYRWILKRVPVANLAALLTVILILLILVAPAILLGRALLHEATDLTRRLGAPDDLGRLWANLENNRMLGSLLRWLDSLGLPATAAELLRSLALWASGAVSPVITGSLQVLGDLALTLFILFYFLRDGEAMLEKWMSVLPFPPSSTAPLLTRITQTMRVSLGGKIVVSFLQGLLGGLMFAWLHFPAPVFWGVIMGILSVFPFLGAFVVWVPVAFTLAMEGDWLHALLVTAWGIAIIHPVDNLLGPVLMGTALRVHTLLMFFSIVGGLAAFGAAGIVIGPLVAAILAGLIEMGRERGLAPE